jgi:hypothetical protein
MYIYIEQASKMHSKVYLEVCLLASEIIIMDEPNTNQKSTCGSADNE